MKYRKAPAHIRGAINREAHRWETADGTSALVALGMVVERVRCPECGFLMNKGEPCDMCPLLNEED